MFHRYGKKPKSSRAKSLNELTRIVSPTQLLNDEKRQALLNQIKEIIALEETRFDSLCLSLIHNLANYCQSLPETLTSYYAQPGGLIDHALNRTEAALSLFKQYLIPEVGQTSLSEEQKLWQYALFSAAILQGIGKLQVDYSIELYDNHGQFLKLWNPLLDHLSALGSHYSYTLEQNENEAFRSQLNLLIARTILPASGFAWLVSNTEVLQIWLALLTDDTHSAGTLGAILHRADGLAIQRYFTQLMLRTYGSRSSRYGRVSTFAGGSPDKITNIEQQIGVEFIQWLTKSLESGQMMLNKVPLLMVSGGILLSSEIFLTFIREHPHYKNWQAVQKAFLSLGLHRLETDGGIYSRFEQNSNHQMHTGIVLANYASILPSKVHLYNIRTGKFAPLSPIDLIYQAQHGGDFTRHSAHPTLNPLPHLTTSGQWQTPHQTVSPDSPKPGVPKGV